PPAVAEPTADEPAHRRRRRDRAGGGPRARSLVPSRATRASGAAEPDSTRSDSESSPSAGTPGRPRPEGTGESSTCEGARPGETAPPPPSNPPPPPPPRSPPAPPPPRPPRSPPP